MTRSPDGRHTAELVFEDEIHGIEEVQVDFMTIQDWKSY